MTQLGFELEAAPSPSPHNSPERRIDVTLARLAEIHESLTGEQQADLDAKPWWNTITMVARIRSMERGEEAALKRPSQGLADAYDRLVSPGEHAGEALLRTFRAVYGPSQTAWNKPGKPNC